MVAQGFSGRAAGGRDFNEAQRAAHAQNGATHNSKRRDVTSPRTLDESQPLFVRP